MDLRAVITFLLGVLLLIVLAACGDGRETSPEAEPTAVSSPGPSPTPAPSATPDPTPTPEPTPTPLPTNTPVPTPTFAPAPVILPTVEVPLETPTPTGAAPLDLDRKLDAIGFRTSLARDLSARGPVDRRIVSPDEMRAMIREDFEEDAEDLEISDRLYTRLGIIEPSVDLSDLLIGAFSDIVLGLFRTDESVLYVVGDEDAFTLQNELTVAHEFVHNLQQIHFDIGGLKDGVEGNSDRSLALRALIEGDASVAELLYRLNFFDEQQQQAAQEEAANVDMSSYLAAPVFIRRTVAFPYVDGPQLVVALYYLTNGFDEVDAAYGSPPSSTEQVIHPDKYGVDEPADVSVPDLAAALANGWSEVDRDVMGELFFRSMLEGAMSFEQAGEAAGGWGGDAYVLLESPDGGDVVASVSVWDTEEDAAEYTAAASAYFEMLTGGEWSEVEDGDGMAMRLSGEQTAAQISVDGITVRLVVAGTADELEAVIEALDESEISVVFPSLSATSTAATSTSPSGN